MGNKNLVFIGDKNLVFICTKNEASFLASTVVDFKLTVVDFKLTMVDFKTDAREFRNRRASIHFTTTALSTPTTPSGIVTALPLPIQEISVAAPLKIKSPSRRPFIYKAPHGAPVELA
jgi:hypothetical protein